MTAKRAPKKRLWVTVAGYAAPALFTGLVAIVINWWNGRQESGERHERHIQDSTRTAIKDSLRDFWTDRRIKRLEVHDGLRKDSE